MREETVEVRLAAEAVAQWVSSKQRRGGDTAAGVGGGHFRSAYLEVVVRVSGFIFPGIAGC